MANPLLKWPGGKRWLVPALVPQVGGAFERYIEPFVGGGALLFSLEPARGIVGDINKDLIACYAAVRRNGPRVLLEYEGLHSTHRAYYEIRDCWNPRCLFKRAARFIYLLRHSWNGLYRVNKRGRFNVPYCPRVRKDELTIEMIVKAQVVLGRVGVRCQDFAETLALAGDADLVFADPPSLLSG
jgi:DNA adenine methylase